MDSSTFRTRWIGRAALALALGAAPALHADTLPFPTPHAAAESDAFLSRKVEAAIAADPQLAGVRPMVNVMGGVAVIGGPVATVDQAERIRRVAEAVPGLQRVVVKCWAVGESPAGPRPAPVAPAASDQPPLALGAGKRPATDARDGDSAALPPRPGVPRSAADRSDDGRAVAKLTMPGSGDRRASDGFLLPPEANRAERPAAPPAHAAIPPTALPTRPVATPVVRHRPRDPVEEARRADPRYAHLVVREQGSVATISGRAPDVDAPWDLRADLVRLRLFSDVRVGYTR